jgi:hypothetical protein
MMALDLLFPTVNLDNWEISAQNVVAFKGLKL